MSARPWIGCLRFHGLLTGEGDGAPAVLLHAGAVWDANRAARGRAVTPGQAQAAARAACPEAEVRRFDRSVAAPLLAAAWDLLAAAASVVEPDAGGRPEAYAAWAGDGPPLPEVRALQAAVVRALPHVDLAVGLGGTRLAARQARPAAGAGLASVAPGTESRFLRSLPVRRLVEEGLVAPALAARLRALGILRCGQLAALPAGVVRGRLGRDGVWARALCLGEDPRPVRAVYPPRRADARRTWPDGLPPEAWAGAAVDVARQATRRLRPGEAAGRVRLWIDADEHVRVWPRPCRESGRLVRAAGMLAMQAARKARAPAGLLQVALDALAVQPAAALTLLPPAPGARRTPDPLEELLARLPRGALRQGLGPPDPMEALLAVLDPWRETP